jgi:hypothetical protein
VRGSIQIPHSVAAPTALREGLASNTVPTAANRDLEAEVTSVVNRAHNIIHVGTLSDDAGSAVDHRVEDRPSLIVGGLAGHHDLPREILPELIESGLIGLYPRCSSPSGLPAGPKRHAFVSAKPNKSRSVRPSGQ